MRRSGLSGAAWVVLGGVSLAALVAGVVWFLTGKSLSDADSWASVGGLVLGVTVGVPGLFVSVASLRLAHRQGRAAPADRLLEELAAALAVEWRREHGTRDLNDLLPVRWSAAEPALADRPERVFGGDPIPVPGAVDDAAGAFRRLPNRRLVILGEPGAGKSVVALELVLGLLADRSPGDPVPVLLPIASWDPAAEELDSWMADRIADTYPALGATEGAATFAAILVRTRRVLPVLDGLDEMAAPSRATAIHAVNRWLPRSEPIVLTCRTDAYRELVHTDADRPGEPLSGAVVVRLEPLRPGDVAVYLRNATPERLAGKWDPIAEQLDRVPDGPLACALSTPLMAALARAAYSRTNADPAVLVRLDSRAAVEDHLVGRFVPALYPDDPKALRWLRFLAWQLDRRGAQDIAWWELPLTVPRPFYVAVVGLLCLLVALVDWLFVPESITPVSALGIGLLVGVGLMLAEVHASLPLRTVLRLPTTTTQLARSARALVAGLSASVAAGFGFGIIYGYARLALVGNSRYLADGLAAAVVIAVVLALPLSLVMLMTTPADIARTTTPRAALRADRNRTLLVVATVALSAGPLLWFRTWPALGAFAGPVLGLVLWLTSAWGALAVLRMWTLAHWPTRLPVRVMGFLADAHRRGVLRQSGATYQFRHLRLQEHLARTHPRPHDRIGIPQGRGPVGPRALYAVSLALGVCAFGLLYFVFFDRLSETRLTRVIPLWLFPVVFGCYGLVGEALARRAGSKPIRAAAADVVREYGKWVLPGVFPFLLLPWRSRILVVTAATAFWAVLVQWFMVAVFQGL